MRSWAEMVLSSCKRQRHPRAPWQEVVVEERCEENPPIVEARQELQQVVEEEPFVENPRTGGVSQGPGEAGSGWEEARLWGQVQTESEAGLWAEPQLRAKSMCYPPDSSPEHATLAHPCAGQTKRCLCHNHLHIQSPPHRLPRQLEEPVVVANQSGSAGFGVPEGVAAEDGSGPALVVQRQE
jgi:hypothetical protein